jgi:hypothetical protein
MTLAGLNAVARHLRSLAASVPVEPGGTPATDGELLKRFVARRYEAAFATLLHRHGPMVLSVGRRIVRHTQDAKDVFQADAELAAADQYEQTAAYKRVSGILASGKLAWVYVYARTAPGAS